MKRNYFNLVELLVVVAIIGILASMLMPALQGAREKSKSAVCIGNNKQIGTAFSIMLDDGPVGSNVEQFPSYWLWYKYLARDYFDDTTAGGRLISQKVFECPTSKSHGNDYFNLDYGYNWYYLGYDYTGSGRHSLWEINSPTDMIMIGDSNEDDTWDSIIAPWTSYPVGDRHTGKGNVLFVDLHAEPTKRVYTYDSSNRPFMTNN